VKGTGEKVMRGTRRMKKGERTKDEKGTTKEERTGNKGEDARCRHLKIYTCKGLCVRCLSV
jgi:hypothetical protein